MATEDVGIRLTLQGRREAAAGLNDTADDLKKVGDEGEKAGKRASSGFAKLGSKVWGVAKVVAKAGIATGIALIGTALYKGFQRLNAIDQAKAKLTGLGHSAKSVGKIMGSALKSVKGTAFGLDEAATVAAGSVAAGIKPGQALTKTLKLIADAASIGGTSMGDMGAIFNKVATSNKVQGDVMNQLNQRGIGVQQLLAKSMHKTTDEVMTMSKKGQISFADFSKAMQLGVGGGAQAAGKTFSGSYKNLMASVGRIGAGLLGGVFPHLAPGIQGITKALSPLEKKAGVAGDKIGKVLGPAFEKIGPWVTSLGPKLSRFGHLVGSIDFSHLTGGSSQVGKSLRSIGASLKGVDLSQLKSSFGKGAADSVSVFSVVIGFLAKHLNTLAKLMPEILVAFAAFKVAQAAQNVLGIASIPIRVANTAALFASARANKALAVATREASGAERVGAASQWSLNAAMAANPIGVIVVGIVLLVAGFVLAYKKISWFRNGVNAAWNLLRPFAAFLGNVVVGYLKTMAKWYLLVAEYGVRGFRFLLAAALATFGGIVHAAARGLGWIPKIGPKIKSAARGFDAFRDTALGALNKTANKIRDVRHSIEVFPKHHSTKITAATGAAAAAVAGLHRQIDNYRPHPILIPVNYHQFATGNAPSNASGAGGLLGAGLGAKLPRRAKGGPVRAGFAYWVGEHQAEIFHAPANGRVDPPSKLGRTSRVAPASLPSPRPVSIDDQAPAAPRGGDLNVNLVVDGNVMATTVVKSFQSQIARR